MNLKINNINLPLDSGVTLGEYLKSAGIRFNGDVKIIKRSVDFRKKSDPRLVYTVQVQSDTDYSAENLKNGLTASLIKDAPHEISKCGDKPLKNRPVIAGFGPAGLFCAYMLAQHGYMPVVLERGSDIDARTKSVETFWKTGAFNAKTNVQFGEGGAGTFSDGKLTTRIGDVRSRFVLETFVKFGAPEEILYAAKPHIGTDILKNVVKNMRSEIIRLGGEVRFNTQLTGIFGSAGKLQYIQADGAQMPCETLVLAIGHSARDTFLMLNQSGIEMQAKNFAVGLRAEHLQSEIDAAQYGSFAGHKKLGAADYNFACNVGGRGVYTFCMCPGGSVVASASEEGGVVTNGMSCHARSGKNANSAVVVQVGTDDFGTDVFGGMYFQKKLETAAFAAGGKNFFAPVQTLKSLLNTQAKTSVQPSYMPGVKECDFAGILPEFILNPLKTGILEFDRRLHGFADGGAVLTGVETRTSSPVRILRRDNGQSVSMDGVYPSGEGAGYAGGIMSAAVDGIKIFEKINSVYKPF